MRDKRCVQGAVALVLVVLPTLAAAQGVPQLTKRVEALEAAVASLQDTVAALQEKVVTLEGTDGELNGRIASVENSEAMKLNPFLAVATDEELNLPLIRFTGVNLQLVNGASDRLQTSDVVNGLGNLIVGYNQQRDLVGEDPALRSGSHNLVVGPLHAYEGLGGFVAGMKNTIRRASSSVSGGYGNTAEYSYTSVSGGYANLAEGLYSSISGGTQNRTRFDGHYASISGGSENTTNGGVSSISGGRGNVALESYSSISGGYLNLARGSYSSVSGGYGNAAWGNYSSISGGKGNQTDAFAPYSSVSGGTQILVVGENAWAAGGFRWPQ